jgi:hypothetical protein
VQLYHDQHGNRAEDISMNSKNTDQCTARVLDIHQRVLLRDAVVWAGKLGLTPIVQGVALPAERLRAVEFRLS